MSGIELCPIAGGDAVTVPEAKTTIGRGPFLQVTHNFMNPTIQTLKVDEKTPEWPRFCLYMFE